MLKYFYILQLFTLPMILSYTDIRPYLRTEISGTVLDKATRAPIERAYVYVVKGEEEATTDRNGVFHIVAWSQAPYTIYATHKDFKGYKLAIPAGQQKITLLLDRK
jgi:hypothetical protein